MYPTKKLKMETPNNKNKIKYKVTCLQNKKR